MSKEERLAHLLNEAAGCGMSDADIRDVATEYFTHDSNAESRPNAKPLFTPICDIVNE